MSPMGRLGSVSKRSQIKSIMNEGIAVRGRHLTVRGLLEATAPGRKKLIVVSVPRTVGGAVVRNRLRRRLRGLVEAQAKTVPFGVGVVVTVRSAGGSFHDLEAELRQLMGNLGSMGRGRIEVGS
ncbi:MAG: ribonuclease P protein component [Acidimicrobiia bacterium]